MLDTVSRGKLYKVSDTFKLIDSKIRSDNPDERSRGLREFAQLIATRFPAFGKFLTLLKERQLTQQELIDLRDEHAEPIFNPHTLKTLVGWGRFTETIGVLRPSNRFYAKPIAPKKYSNADFWRALREAHNKYLRTKTIGVPSYYSSFPKLRDLVGQELIINLEEFDVYLHRLLEDPLYRSKIALAVARPGYLASEKGKPGGLLCGLGRGFKYKGHNYYFLRIK